MSDTAPQTSDPVDAGDELDQPADGSLSPPIENDGSGAALPPAVVDEEPWVAPEPIVLGFVHQDNVSVPGVQTTHSVDGTVSEHGEALAAEPEVAAEAPAEGDDSPSS